MSDSHRSCSGTDPRDFSGDIEFRKVLDAVFCGCLEELQTGEKRLRRELFRRVEIEKQPLPAAARSLGLEAEDAGTILAGARRDVAVLLALGLFASAGTETAAASGNVECSCRSN